MRIKFLFFIFFLFTMSFYGQGHDWKGKRITNRENQNKSNTWINFRRDININSIPNQAIAKIACDSKYWLWVNGNMVVFEGQLKRGPNPNDTYYDEIDIAPFLTEGKNTIAILLWYFGKDGFSHNSSGQAGLVFDCAALNLYSDGNWLSKLDRGFSSTIDKNPNYRLPESNILFDARKSDFKWIDPNEELTGSSKANVLGTAESKPWNKLVLRPIPHWKNYGIANYTNPTEIPKEGHGEWIICKLPYNCHVTPILDIEAPAGLTIKMQTDNFDYMGLHVASVRAEYITKEGAQQYESLGWMNGHVVKYWIPKGVKINTLTYRETGFNTEFTGYFKSSDPFYEKLWQKATRTLYVTMRDTYMDCPDRERAQWWGDLVNESGEAFYALSPSSASIAKKGILELINWQRANGIIYSPIPEGNWNAELPGQMLASIGYYGFWNYYINTGDKETIANVYDGVKRYLDVWKLKPNGTLIDRKGDWYWGDWGKEIDKQLLYNAWYYLALKGYLNMSELLGKTVEADRTQKELLAFKEAFNNIFWDGKGYRRSDYKGTYDDRAQALAVVSGLADKTKYKTLLKIFKTSHLASPYMEKYVLEALFVMEESKFGLERMKKRYHNMVNVSPWTTLNENFGDETTTKKPDYGTNNHAWSGGGLTILAQYVCGLYPIEPAWKTFMVKPQLGDLDYAETGNKTIAGNVNVKIAKVDKGLDIVLTVPNASEALVYVPLKNKNVIIDGKKVYTNIKEDAYNIYRVKSGKHKISAR
ncbi:alpha-L-rhamnosidase C-terminal domain-containing protein [Flavivirga aquimarina]|uniref:Alpha-L-rhamnosidase C-terminal domain-containing protein n=1 Tax=Flavivirga aquimarina TaxID=2027862 RepID=A0ABT8W5P3_9FLAO|nr:alpha-L-rhamnosidase C-terminal domain-containing protein [Flavivirga aquimarina]MDO5968420.1 alpha-L-rhamnosidase C-terminal domain-containing protein [Flavivirga aquimarina]